MSKIIKKRQKNDETASNEKVLLFAGINLKSFNKLLWNVPKKK
jgi:hypothetical protein